MNAAALIGFAGAALSAGLALTAIVRARRSAAHWPFAAGMALLAIEGVCNGLTAKAVSPAMMVRCQLDRLLALAFLPGIWLLFSFNYARGDARASRKRWRWLLAVAFVLPGLTAVLFRGSLITSLGWNSLASLWVLRLGWAGIVLYAFLLIGSILVLTNLERTFRAAVGTMRWRIKFMVLGVGVLFAVRIYTSSQALLFHTVELSVENLNSGAMLVTSLLIVRSLHRTGHFEVDVYPSQSVLQNSITFVVAGIYLVAVGILAKIASYFGADSSFTFNAFLALISFVALAVLLQSDNARLHLRRFVSRNFHRPLYDYRTVWRKFTEGAATQVTPVELCRSLVGLLADVFQSLSVAIWLVDDQREVLTLAASTFLSEAKGEDLAPKAAETAEVIAHFRENPEPVELESVNANLSTVLTRMHPREFIAGAPRVGAPLTSQGEVIGLVLLGDRVGGAAFTLQDFDMLKCVTNHVSASLRNMQLSQKILQTKELEAFQTMAAFFVHDLKNATSTLNLMLQNLPVHFDDPEFRADSLRGISNTATHINRLIARLSLLRREQSLTLIESDLNEIVAESLAGLDKRAGCLFSKNLQPVPKVMLDREHMHKVVTNLILNATEAVSAAGVVRVETSLDPNWVVLTVADNGCGMTSEFLSRGLFRPFQTTKKTGLGIGMFQSKMIVESHGGRITVASEPGHGTTFRVSLPVPKPRK